MKTCSVFILVGMLLLSACTPKPIETIVYKPVDVYVPVPCDVVVNCEFTGDGYIPTTKLLECVIRQKRALDKCRQEPGD